MKLSRLSCVSCIVGIVSLAHAQSDIDPVNKFAWGENVGWTNWRDANGGAQGVAVGGSFLAGYIWGENVGWINVGDGTPGALCSGQPCYANLNGADFGVNIDAGTGELFGYAWGENVGWINFDGGALASPPNPAELGSDCSLHGYTWGENIGWINLDDLTHYVGIQCVADLNGDCNVNPSDLAMLLGAWGPNPGHLADLNGDGNVNAADLAALLGNWGAC